MAHRTETARSDRYAAGADWMVAFNAVTDPMFAHDSDYRIVYANGAYLERAGEEPAAVLGRPYWEVYPRREGPMPGCRRALEQGGGEAGEDEFSDADGNVFLSRGYPVRMGDTLYAVHILFDVSAARREQSRLRRLHRALHEGREAFVALDAERRIRYVNPAFERLLGYRADQLVGESPQRFWPQEVGDAFRALLDGGANWEGETVRRHKDGTPIPVYMHLATVRDERGGLDGWVASLRDLREQKADEARLARQAYDLGERLKELRCLYAIARLSARDERTPDTVFGQVVAELCRAYQYPEVTEARVRFEGRDYASNGFRDSASVQRAPLRVDGRSVGEVAVAYREARPVADEGPFLREERALLDAVADQLGAAIALQRRRAEMAEREAFYRTLLEDMPVLICRWRADGTITYVSDSYCRYFGKAREDLVGHGFLPLIPPEDHDEVRRLVGSLTRERPSAVVENRAYDATGAVRWQRWTNRALFDSAGDLLEYQATGEDITEQRAAALEVESLARFPAENPYPVLRVGADGTLLLANPASEPLLAAVGARLGAAVPAVWREVIDTALEQGRAQELEQTGGERRYLFTVAPIAEAGYVNLYGTDVTELRQNEERLLRRLGLEAVLAAAARDFVDSAGEAVDGAIDRTLAAIGMLVGVDRSYLFLLAHDGERMSNTHEWCGAGIGAEKSNLQGLPTAEFPRVIGELRSGGRLHVPDIAALPAGKERETLEAQGIRSLVLVAVMVGGEMVGFIGFDAVRDKVAWRDEDLRLLELVADLIGSALARRDAEGSLRRANRALRTLSACNEALVRAEDEVTLLRSVCERIVDLGGYRMAWAGYVEPDPGRRIRPAAHAGVEDGYLDAVSVTWDGDEPCGRGPMGQAVRTGEPAVVRFAAEDPRFAPWREAALARGYGSVAALPLRAGGETLGGLAIYAAEPDAFDGEAIALLQELADDLGFGIASLRARDERERATAQVARSEARLHRLVDRDPNAVLVVARDGSVRFANAAANALFDRPGLRLVDGQFGLPLAFQERTELSIARPGGGATTVEMYTVDLEWSGEPCWLVTLYDVTELRHHEARLRRLNRTHAVLSECNQAMVRAESERDLLEAFCARLAEVGGFPLAWVGYRQADAEHSVRPMARAGAAQGYVDGLRVGWGDDALGRGPTGTAIRSGTPAISRDNQVDPGFGPWREAARRYGLHSGIALPLWTEGEVIGALMIYAEEPDAFDAEEQALLAELADDLAFGIHGQRTRQARQQAEALLQVRNRAIEAARNGIVVTDARDGTVVYVNPAFSEITGYTADEAIGRDPLFLAGADRDQAGLEALFSALKRGKEVAVLLRNYRKDGTLFWNELHLAPVLGTDAAPTHFVGVINDVTERKRYEEQLEYQANFDPLTGLPNRNLMQDRLTQALMHAQRHTCLAAVLFLDVDRFKLVNDTLGHDSGDALLKVVAERLAAVVQRSDTVARYGGDEFVVILPDLRRAEDVTGVVGRLLKVLAEPLLLEGHDIQVTASVGASLYPRDGEDGATLLKNADSAMYRAKELGRNQFQFFTPELNTRLLARMNLERGLRRAIERQELFLHYQPQLDLRSGAVVGVEALLRWRHPELGIVSPAEFIPLAEETGLIVPIGAWVLREACRQAARWHEAGLPPVTVAVNVSVRQMVDQDLERTVAEVLAASGLEPARLELELTESAMMERPEAMADELRRLKALGVQLALDDFGTGYSSLNHLHRFPFDKVKIDQGFVHDITHNPHNAAIVLSILSLAQGLGLTVIAEGVETEAQLRYLRFRGCDQMQGYFFSRPLPAEEAAASFSEGLRTLSLDEEEQPTLLAVDDEPNITRALRRLFRGEGYRVLTANTPEEAFELLALHQVQVLICDQRMPEMSGTELLSRVKRLYPHTIRMILSGFTELKTVTEAVNLGWVYKFLTKPWEDDELKKAVRGAFAEYEHGRRGA